MSGYTKSTKRDGVGRYNSSNKRYESKFGAASVAYVIQMYVVPANRFEELVSPDLIGVLLSTICTLWR